jgi:hypothetical protein
MKIISLIFLAAAISANALDWKQTDHSLALTSGTNIVWQFNYSKDGKPYFHPLTVAGSAPLTALSPKDHPWHRGLWFSWKYLNKINYWEEDRKTGLATGRTEVLDVKVTPCDDYSARFEMKLAYHPPGGANLLTEERLVEVSAPGKEGTYTIDWSATFTAGDVPVVLERTPPYGAKDGVRHGGYAGLSLRMTPDAKKWKFFDSEGRVAGKDNGFAARWFAASGEGATVAILEHPKSFRYPTPWYVITGMPFYQPAILFVSPHTIPAGGALGVRYRVVIQSGAASAEALEREWKDFAVLDK